MSNDYPAGQSSDQPGYNPPPSEPVAPDARGQQGAVPDFYAPTSGSRPAGGAPDPASDATTSAYHQPSYGTPPFQSYYGAQPQQPYGSAPTTPDYGQQPSYGPGDQQPSYGTPPQQPYGSAPTTPDYGQQPSY
ncbi:MAG: hypothetical protein Q3997_08040, partial [Propionibacteriaceae bacterium]|nr:hypothetical protein [Propionibacteriaceae bacterium]